MPDTKITTTAGTGAPVTRTPPGSGALRREVKAAYTIWYREVLRFFQDRMRIFGSLGQPLLFLFIFGAGLASSMSGLGGGALDFKQFMFPGVLGMTVLFTAVFGALSVVWDREFGFLREVLVAPVSRVAVVIGKVIGGSTVAMFQGAIVLLLAPLIGIRPSFGQVLALLGLMFMLALVMSSFGILLAARQKTMEGFQVVMQFLLMPMLFLSGAFFPLQGAPAWLDAVAKIDPVTYAVDPLRQVALRGSVPDRVIAQLRVLPIGADLAILVGLLVVFLVPAVLLFSKQD